MIEIEDLSIPDVKRIRAFHHEDHRGTFVKLYLRPFLQKAGLEAEVDECFFSVSTKGVLRGMHFQVPPFEHTKIVSCISGEILDVALDIRKASPTFGQAVSLRMNGKSPELILIPPGFAHGFLTISAEATVVYFTSKAHSPGHDQGIRWNSFGFDWNATDPVLSPRDAGFGGFEEFNSPF